MKKIFAIVALILLLAGHAFGATYYVTTAGSGSGDGSTYSNALSLADFKTSEAAAGIAGDDTVYFCDTFDGTQTLVFTGSSGTSGHVINYRFDYAGHPGVIDSRVSLDGTWTFTNASTYSESAAWTQEGATEVYRKASYYAPYQLWEDSTLGGTTGTKLTAVVTVDQTEGDAIERGQFSFNNSYIYYRSSDGQAPASHTLLAPNMTLQARNSGGGAGVGVQAYIAGVDYLTFTGLTNLFANCQSVSDVTVVGDSDYITFVSPVSRYNDYGHKYGNATSTVSYVTTTGGVFTSNGSQGIMIQGSTTDVVISGSTFTGNGRTQFYNGTSLFYPTDGDSIGVGGVGGTIARVSINGNIFTNSGPPAASTGDNFGTHIFVGTAETMTVTELSILRNYFSGSHVHGVVISKANDFVFANNILNGNLENPSASFATAVLNVSTPATFTAGKVYNNTFMNSLGAGYNATVRLDNTVAGLDMRNNIFYNNGAAGAFADFWLYNATKNYIESNNLFYRSGTGYDNGDVIAAFGYFTQTQLAAYATASEQGANNINASPLLTADYKLGVGSTARTGATPVLTYAEWIAAGGDYYGKYPTGGTLSMGATQYQKELTEEIITELADGIRRLIEEKLLQRSKSTDAGSYVQ